MTSGIGLNNVNERLRVLYGSDDRLSLSGEPGKGARARVMIPLAVTPRRMAS
jgi:sensor histidine kinase YesM